MFASLNNSARAAGTSLLLFCVSLFLAAYSAKNPGVMRIGSLIVAEILHPFQRLNQRAIGGAAGLWENYIALIGMKKENETLKSRLATLEAENSRLLEFEKENQRLNELLGVATDLSISGIAAEVIGYDPTNWVQTFTVNRGSIDGVRTGMPALEGDGLVGQVVTVSPTTSRILLITDHGSGIDALIQGSRTRGIVEGSGGFYARWRYVLREEEVNVGDRVLTSGMDGVYPKGLAIGIVSAVEEDPGGMFHEIEVKPEVEFSRVENVLIVTSPLPAAAQATAAEKGKK